MTELECFTCRAYGILVREGKVLVTRERVEGVDLLKFPGGGIELGESPERTLEREFKEETGLLIRVGPVLHVSKKLQISRFAPRQVLALYWRVEALGGQLAVPATEQVVCSVAFESLDLVDREAMFPSDREVLDLLWSGIQDPTIEGDPGRR